MICLTKEQPSTQARSNNSDTESQITENEGSHLSPKRSHVTNKTIHDIEGIRATLLSILPLTLLACFDPYC